MKRILKFIIFASIMGAILGQIMRWDQVRPEPIEKKVPCCNCSNDGLMMEGLALLHRDEQRELNRPN